RRLNAPPLTHRSQRCRRGARTSSSVDRLVQFCSSISSTTRLGGDGSRGSRSGAHGALRWGSGGRAEALEQAGLELEHVLGRGDLVQAVEDVRLAGLAAPARMARELDG